MAENIDFQKGFLDPDRPLQKHLKAYKELAKHGYDLVTLTHIWVVEKGLPLSELRRCINYVISQKGVID